MNRDGNYIDEEGADDGAIAGDHGEYSTIASQSGLYNQIEEEFGLAREGVCMYVHVYIYMSVCGGKRGVIKLYSHYTTPNTK
jgi:hypothetical protein